MEQIVKILIGDDGSPFSVTLAQKLREFGFYAVTRLQKAAALQQAIRKEMPDVLLLDLSNLAAEELCEIMELVRGNRIQTAVILPRENTMLQRQLMKTGIRICLTKPLDAARLADEIKRYYPKKAEQPKPAAVPEVKQTAELPLTESPTPEYTVTAMMQRLGIPANLQGYQYLREAILAVYVQPQLTYSVTKKLYPLVANHFETTPSRVERSIRHAIDLAWERGAGEQPPLEYLGIPLPVFRKKPTNSELIALIADQLRVLQPTYLK